MQRIIIRHISGSKVNQVEEFLIDQFKVLTLGRDPDQTIRYDSETDDLVSRQHARISLVEDLADRFVITDLNSRNGTYVNKQRISSTVSIQAGDEIQLGPGGPVFQFDLAPSPDGILLPTREAGYVRETREPVSRPDQVGALTKAPVGRFTVERMLGQYQQSSRKILFNFAAALVGVIVIGAGVLFYLNLTTKQELATRYDSLGEQLNITRDMVKVSQRTSPTDPIMSPVEIAKKFGQTTVYIEVSWKLIHTKSGQQVYHRYEGQNPVYIKIGERVFPWLSTDANNNTNKPIGSEHTGSGFVVAPTGYIMTARHVAATWQVGYHNFPSIQSKIYDVDSQTLKIQQKGRPLADAQQLQEILQNANRWVPARTKLLVQQRKGVYYVVLDNPLEGRVDKFDVTFLRDKLRVPARLVRMSDQHDVALIKVDLPRSVPELNDLYDNDSERRPGTMVTVLGYPGVSPAVVAKTKSQDPLSPPPLPQVVPDLTITNGLIGRVIRGEAISTGEAISKSGTANNYYSEAGDVIQLTVNPGAGSSGGPVFNDRGKVIGVLSFSRQSDVQISFAVPIRFGLDIMGLNPVLKELEDEASSR